MPAKLSVDPMPTLLCAGQIASIDAPSLSKSQDEEGNSKYAMLKIAIDPLPPGRKAKPIYFLYRPEWFMPLSKFNPNNDLNHSEKFVYRLNVGEPDANKSKLRSAEVSRLTAFLGGKQAASGIDATIQEACGGVENMTWESVGNVLRDAFIAAEATFGYTLVQQQEKTGEFDEKGRELKVATPYYEIGQFFLLDKSSKRGIESMVNYAVTIMEREKETNPHAESMVQVAFDVALLDR